MKNTSIENGELLTVVVPVYNTAQFLRRCIKSIIYQNYKKLDIILIDDGSTDESAEICDEFLLIDNRIRVFHGKNKGSVAARNLGIELAKGKLITFVDSDDWIEPDMYYELMNAYMECEPDLVTSGITIENGNKIVYEIDTINAGIYKNEAIKEKVISCMMYDIQDGKRAITPSMCNKIYKIDLLKTIIIDLDEGITYGDDAAITYTYIAKASKIMILNASWYHYVIHSDSMSRTYDISSFEKVFKFYNYMKKIFVELGFWDIAEMQVKKYTKTFLIPTIRGVFGIGMESTKYLFPFELIEKESSIVIYGAGNVGVAYKENILKSGYAKLQGWVDQNCENLIDENFSIESPDNLQNMEFDYLIIAIKDKDIALEVQRYISGLGIKKEKIIWKVPVPLV
jgi:glycosyltransferase involved in cell wall biosynthesis